MISVPKSDFKQKSIERFFQFIEYPSTNFDSNHNPSPLPVSLERRHLGVLKTEDYFVSLKLDGSRFQLMLANDIKWKIDSGTEIETPCFALIDRSNEMFPVFSNVEATLLQGTLMDGEMIESQTTSFVIFDCLCWKGDKSIKHKNLTERQKLVRKFAKLVPKLRLSDTHYVDVKTKAFVHTDDLRFHEKAIALRQLASQKIPVSLSDVNNLIFGNFASDIPSDGLIWTPGSAEKFKHERDPCLFKYKPEHTLDLMYSGNGVWLCGLDDKTQDFQICFPKYQLRLKGVPNDVKPKEILEFAISSLINGKLCLVFKRKRFDKQHPNSSFTIARTLASYSDNITVNDILKLF